MPQPLTDRQRLYRKALLGKIHTAPLYLQLYKDDRPGWEALLFAHFKRRSSADLSIAQLIRLNSHLRRLGPACPAALAPPATPAQVSYLLALWRQRARCPAEKNLLAFARKQTGLALIGLHALNQKQIGGLIAAVKHMSIRRVE